MKVSVTQENLTRALGAVGRIVSTRTTLPVLGNILIGTDSGRLKLSATNLEIGINYWIGAKIEEEGALTVPARLFSDFITSLPAENNINLSADGAVLHVQTTHFQSTINGISAEEFPLIPQLKAKPALKLPVEDLREAISQTAIVASPDEARPVLTGVYVYIEESNLVMAATDSYRLAEKKLKVAKGGSDFKAIVPARTLMELGRVLGEVTGEVEVLVEENQVMFKIEGMELTSRLVEGQFPNYRQIIPAAGQNDTSFEIETDEFGRLAKVAGLFARESAGSIRLEVKGQESLVNVISTTSQVGENTSSAECDTKGPDAEIALNSRYLTEALGAIRSDDVKFVISGKLNPCVIRPVGKGAADYTHIIMPLRT